MSIQLVTYANQTVTPTNDAIIYEKAVDQNGIFYGCNVTVTSNTVNITGGYGIVCGREFVINSDSLTVTLAPSGTLEGRLYVRLDLADADAPIQLLTVTGNTLPALTQDDDVNYTNGVYEMELATFTVGVSALSDVVETFEEVKGTKGMVLELLNNSGTDYIKLPDGTLICWGSVVVPSGSYTAYWNLPVPFIRKTDLSVQVTPLESGTSWNVNYAASSTSQIQIGRTPNNTINNYYILAFGKWK